METRPPFFDECAECPLATEVWLDFDERRLDEPLRCEELFPELEACEYTVMTSLGEEVVVSSLQGCASRSQESTEFVAWSSRTGGK